jgi:hypothetical protein
MTTRHESPYPTAPSRPIQEAEEARPLEQARPVERDVQRGTLAERIAANREAIDALKVGTARLRARTGPLREGTVAHLSVGTERLAARVERDSRPRDW